ncbi:unnamed protein product [Brassicogethes aeneus]|uniref:Probable deoxycytidylate deaminase n=1 Tax=Brassicogethes aeneus TaxID=1431903 RepID=A0A9P0FCF2_BRAAE|nr:unnamed protein product [Brassicogethes aeneus]
MEGDKYFMTLACVTAKRSDDPVTKVGACIVNENGIIVGVGYNDMPAGCDNWAKSTGALEHKKNYVCHAEFNAYINKTCADVKNCKIYVTLFPCNECAKIIIKSGIQEVIYLSDKRCDKLYTQISKIMLKRANVTYRQLLLLENMEINFAEFLRDEAQCKKRKHFSVENM